LPLFLGGAGAIADKRLDWSAVLKVGLSKWWPFPKNFPNRKTEAPPPKKKEKKRKSTQKDRGMKNRAELFFRRLY